jgi:hypothetical protein
VVEIGLPGLYEPGRYSDLWRQEFHDRVDAKAAKELDPDAAETADDALFGEVEKTTDLSARTSCERLAILLKSGPGQGNGRRSSRVTSGFFIASSAPLGCDLSASPCRKRDGLDPRKRVR